MAFWLLFLKNNAKNKFFWNATPQKDIKYNHYWFVFKEESIIGYKNRNHVLRTFRGFFKNHIKFSRTNYQDASKGSAVCNSLHCGTRYLIAVPARLTAQVPRWAGNVSGGQVQFLGDFGVLVYPPLGVARQSHCTPAVLSIVMSFGHCTDHCTTASVAEGTWKRKKLPGM